MTTPLTIIVRRYAFTDEPFWAVRLAQPGMTTTLTADQAGLDWLRDALADIGSHTSSYLSLGGLDVTIDGTSSAATITFRPDLGDNAFAHTVQLGAGDYRTLLDAIDRALEVRP